jgi:uncharacterized DUF497 family protein
MLFPLLSGALGFPLTILCGIGLIWRTLKNRRALSPPAPTTPAAATSIGTNWSSFTYKGWRLALDNSKWSPYTYMDILYGLFIWDERKERANILRLGVPFALASEVFLDPNRLIYIDEVHSREEDRFHCIGKVGERVVTVRFTYRRDLIRIFGAGYWRRGVKIYETRP